MAGQPLQMLLASDSTGVTRWKLESCLALDFLKTGMPASIAQTATALRVSKGAQSDYKPCMNRLTVVERAFELAKSGEVASVEQLSYRLKREGFQSVQSHLLGRGIRKQLLDIVKANQTTAEVQSEKQTD